MKRLIPVIGLLLISNLCFSQISAGIDYIHNNNKDRKYSNSLNGFDINLKYYLNKRFNISSDLILFNKSKTRELEYKNWAFDLNGEINILNKESFMIYGIVGLGFRREAVIPLDVIVDPLSNSDLKKNLFFLNLGAGAQYKIYKKVWLKLNLYTNSSYEITVNPGLIYRFK